MKVVLDTNVVLSGFFFGGVPGRVPKACNTGRIEVMLSADLTRMDRADHGGVEPPGLFHSASSRMALRYCFAPFS